MPVDPNAIITNPDEVWPHLDAGSKEKVEFALLMDSWLNSATILLERYCNRKIKARKYENISQNGNGRLQLYLEHYPVLDLESLRIYDPDFSQFDDIDVSLPPTNQNPEIALAHDTGRITLLPDAPIFRFTTGRENIVSTYTAGFEGMNLDPFKDAVRELIAERWHQRGRDPREASRSSSTNTSASFTMTDTKAISPITWQIIQSFRKYEV